MKHLLLPSDFSENAQRASEYAIALFKKEACTFYVLHAYSKTFSNERESSLNQELYKTMNHLKTLSKGLEHYFEGILVNKDLITGVEPLISKKDIDFIIMGTKGSTALKGIFIGSNAIKMLHTIRYCPILLVPETYQHVPIARFMIATKFDHYYERVELNPVIRLAKKLKVETFVVRITDGEPLSDYQEKLKELLKKKMKGTKFSFEEVPFKESIAKTISLLAKERNIHLLAMIHHRHSFFKALFATGVIKKLAFNTSVPFLVLPEVE